MHEFRTKASPVLSYESAADAFFDLLERIETVNANTQMTTY